MNSKNNYELISSISTTRKRNATNTSKNLYSKNITTSHYNMNDNNNKNSSIKNKKSFQGVNKLKKEKDININDIYNNNEDFKNYKIKSPKNEVPKKNNENNNTYIDLMSYKNINNNYFYNIQNNYEKNENENKQSKKDLSEKKNIILNNLISINSNRIFKYANKRIKNEINQNPSLLGVNKSNNHISEEGVYETNMNTSGKSSFNNVHSYNIHVNSKICTPLSLKKNVKNINNIFKVMNKNKNYETDFNKDNYKDKFEKLKNRMNRLIGNLFDIIDSQQHKLIEINNK
jgi:hypothetical protein